jgi:predicted O-methyltransferase YrrM
MQELKSYLDPDLVSMQTFPAQCPEPRINQARFKAEPREQTLFLDVCKLVQPSTILEVGSWMGSSAIAWARASSEYKPNAVIYCVDTWLGSVEHYLSSCGDNWNIEKLSLSNYGPTFFDDFLRNVWESGYQNRIIPFRADSSSALPFFIKQGLAFDVVYVDGAHDFHSVFRDISEALQLISANGLVCGDDFGWGSVKTALRQVAICHSIPISVYTKNNDFVLLNDTNHDFANTLLHWGYKKWGPSRMRMRRSLYQLQTNLKGFLLKGLSTQAV